MRRTRKEDEVCKIIARAALHGCSANGPHSCTTRYSARSCHAAVHYAPALVKCNHASAPGCKPQSAPQPACSGGQGNSIMEWHCLSRLCQEKQQRVTIEALPLPPLAAGNQCRICTLHLAPPINKRLSVMHISSQQPRIARMESENTQCCERCLQMGPLTATRGFGFSESH